MNKIAVLIPCYNESLTIKTVNDMFIIIYNLWSNIRHC